MDVYAILSSAPNLRGVLADTGEPSGHQDIHSGHLPQSCRSDPVWSSASSCGRLLLTAAFMSSHVSLMCPADLGEGADCVLQSCQGLLREPGEVMQKIVRNQELRAACLCRPTFPQRNSGGIEALSGGLTTCSMWQTKAVSSSQSPSKYLSQTSNLQSPRLPRSSPLCCSLCHEGHLAALPVTNLCIL